MFSTRSKPRLVPSVRRARPRLEVLEGRALLATLTVSSPLDSGPGTLRNQVAAAVSGDTIKFAPSLNGQTITLTSGPVVDIGKSLNIAGPGASKLAISGGDTTSIFVFQNDPAPGSTYIDVSVSGLTLKDGNAATTGGAIFAQGVNLTLTNDVFLANHSEQGGGAIRAQAPFDFGAATVVVSIANSQFSENTTNGVGGAFEGFNSNVSLASVTAHDNSALFFGGGFTVSGGLTVSNSDFRNNSGGAISSFTGFLPTDPGLVISKSTFVGNTAQNGGAVQHSGLTSSYTNSVFENNVATNPFFASGGAITDTRSVSIDGCTFKNNRVEGDIAADGGAVFLSDPANTSVTNSTFKGNRAISPFATGGALEFQNFNFSFDPVTVTIANVTFEDNRAIATPQVGSFALARGGALAVTGIPGTLTLTDVSFRRNAAIGGDGGTGRGGNAQGGAMAASGAFGIGANNLTLNRVEFAENTAKGGRGDQAGGLATGGALDGLFGLPVTINGGIFRENSAIAGGGGNGSGLALGGAIQGFPNALTLNDTQFLLNTAKAGDGGPGQAGSIAYGGAISAGNVTINGGTYLLNQAIGGRGGNATSSTGVGGRGGDARGGAISTGNLIVNNGQFIGNAAIGGKGGSAGPLGTGGEGGDAYGGAIVLDDGGSGSGQLIINDGLFVANIAIGGPGGAGGTEGATGLGYGGAIANRGGTVVIKKKVKFVKNYASTAGNNIYGPYTTS